MECKIHTHTHTLLYCSITPQPPRSDNWSASASPLADWLALPSGHPGEDPLSQLQRWTLKPRQPTWQDTNWSQVKFYGPTKTGETRLHYNELTVPSFPSAFTFSSLSGWSEVDPDWLAAVLTLTWFTESCSISGLASALGKITRLY